MAVEKVAPVAGGNRAEPRKGKGSRNDLPDEGSKKPDGKKGPSAYPGRARNS